MKRLIILLMIFNGWQAYAQVKSGNSAVAVLEFQKTGAITSDDVQTLTNRFRAMLFQTKAFNVIERQKMKEILKEQEFILSDNCGTNECAVQVGQLLGVEYMIAGDIGLIGDTYTIDLRMIDVASGQLVQTHSKDYEGKIAGLLEIMKQIANSFARFKTDAQPAKKEHNADALQAAQVKSETETAKGPGFWGEKLHSKNLAFRILFGAAVPTGKFNTQGSYNNGSSLTLNCSYFLTSKLSVGLDLGMQDFDNDENVPDYKLKAVSVQGTGRYYTVLKRFKNYIALGLGFTKLSSDELQNDSFFSSKLGTGISYEIIKKLNGEISLDFANANSKKKYGYNTTYTQLSIGLNYQLNF